MYIFFDVNYKFTTEYFTIVLVTQVRRNGRVKNMSIIVLDKKDIPNVDDFCHDIIKETYSETFSSDDLIVNGKKKLLIIPETLKAKKTVKKLNLTEFKDYVLYKYYKKKIVVIYGNCHMGILSEMLNSYFPFKKEFVIYPFELICNITSKEYLDNTVFEYCDVLIHQSIRENNRYGVEFASCNIIQKTKKGCQVIAVPNVYHLPMCFFPQFLEEKEFRIHAGTTIFFRDRLIEDMIQGNKKIDEIIECYNSTSTYSEVEIEKKWRDFIRKIEKREKDWDIKISDYIIQNAGKVQLFYDPNHPTNEFIKHIVIELLKLLKINVDEDIISDIDVHKLDSYEMPICASVCKFFGLDYNSEIYELRKTGIKLCSTYMDLRQYVIQYYCMVWESNRFSFCLRIKSLFGYIILKSKGKYFKIIGK